MKNHRSENRDQLNLFEATQQTSIKKEILTLDRQMAKAVEKGEYERAKVLADKQEKLLGALMSN
jgi:protein-arginine kinase activator protein McsA